MTRDSENRSNRQNDLLGAENAFLREVKKQMEKRKLAEEKTERMQRAEDERRRKAMERRMKMERTDEEAAYAPTWLPA
jgi:hypothetical protein